MNAGMLNQITTTLLHGQNQFASGGLLLMVIGGIAAYFKGVPASIYKFLKKQLTISMAITDDHDAFEWVAWWFQSREYSKRMRNVDAFTPNMADGVRLNLKPAPGTHWFFHHKRPLFIDFSRATEKKGYNNRREESYDLWTWGRDQKFLKALLTEIHTEYNNAHAQRPALKCWAGSYWAMAGSYTPRPLDSVILPSGLKETLLRDIKKFKESESWYKQMGVPYHRGYLLHGPPGTGKTSLVSGLSSHFNSTVYVLKLSEMTDGKLQEAISEAGNNSMIVLEDIDCAVNKVRKLEPKKEDPEQPLTPAPEDEPEEHVRFGLTLSGLLNALDGMQTPNGAQFFMTTNHVENIDVALLRPGRTDMRVYLGPASEWQKAQLYMRFFPKSDGVEALNFIMQKPLAVSMADFQEELMQKRSQT
jgi:chaperone BCS1